MVEFKWIQMSLFLILVLHFTAVTGQDSPHIVVRDGDEVTLPCKNVKDGQQKCGYTTWLYSGSVGSSLVELVNLGQIGENAKSNSDRLNVTANCSLVIKKVTDEDAGQYTCRQFISGRQDSDSVVFLSLLTMTERKDDDKVTLSCSVSTRDACRHSVKWLYEGKDVDEDHEHMKTSQSDCYATVTFHYSFLKQKSKHHELFQCEVKDVHSNKVLFPFSLQSSDEKPGKDATSATITTTTTTTAENRNKRTNSAPTQSSFPGCCWWFYMIVAIGVLAILIIAVTVITWKRTKRNKTLMDDNTGVSLNPAGTQFAPETSQDTADPEDGVTYSSVSFIKKTKSKAPVKNNDEEEGADGDAVTYSTVKTSSSAAASFAEPSDLYAPINKPKK